MMHTLTILISDATINKNQKNRQVYQLKDPRYPLYLRYNKERNGGSWILVHYSKGKQIRRKIASFPAVKSKSLFSRLSEIKLELSIDVESKNISVGQFVKVSELLNWYKNRAIKDKNLSKERKANIKSIINLHLLPRLCDVNITQLSHRLLDDKLMWPLQEIYALSTVRAIFALFKVIFSQAKTLNLIEIDYIGNFKFNDFIDAKINPKDAAIRPEHVPSIVKSLSEHDYVSSALIAIMLSYGTRIGETRLMRWDHIDFDNKELFFPSVNTKTRQAHKLPLTDHMINYLKKYYEYRKRHCNCQYLFSINNVQVLSATTASRYVKSISKGSWTAHDLRKVARTVWADLGIDYMVAEMLLNHALSKLDKTYIHTYAEQQKTAALNKYHDWLHQYGLFFGSKYHDQHNTNTR